MTTNPAEPSLSVEPTPAPVPAANPVESAPDTSPASPPAITPLSQFRAQSDARKSQADAQKKAKQFQKKRRQKEEEDDGPRQVQEDAPQRRAHVPPPSKRDPLSPELEAEFNAMFAGDVLAQAMSGGAVQADTLELESRHQANVVRVHGDNVFFSLPSRNEGVASVRVFREPPQPGANFDVIIKSFNADDGLYEVTVPGGAIEVGDWSDIHEGSVIEARVTGSNTGGLEVMVNNIRGFIPASQVALYRVENFAEFVGQKVLCVVTEANEQRRNLVLSRRAVLEREKEEVRKKAYEELQVGQTLDGVVRSVKDFGAFVELSNGLDGLIHISQLSWERVKHPSEVLQEGQKVRVKVDKINEETGKIGLSYRDLLDHPWLNIQEKFPVGAVVTGTVSRLAAFGAFVKLAPGVEGLVHISELAHHRVTNVAAVLKEGQDVQVKVLSVDAESQRIGLSMKAMVEAPKPKEAEPEPEEPPREPVIPRRNAPLKGGIGRPTGGDKFGLNW